MARGKFGADSNEIVTALEGGQTLIKKATSYLGQKPAFWGRRSIKQNWKIRLYTPKAFWFYRLEDKHLE